MVSHPETGLDSPIGSDRERGRDTSGLLVIVTLERLVLCRVTCCIDYIRVLEEMLRACVLDHKGRG